MDLLLKLDFPDCISSSHQRLTTTHTLNTRLDKYSHSEESGKCNWLHHGVESVNIHTLSESLRLKVKGVRGPYMMAER